MMLSIVYKEGLDRYDCEYQSVEIQYEHEQT